MVIGLATEAEEASLAYRKWDLSGQAACVDIVSCGR